VNLHRVARPEVGQVVAQVRALDEVGAVHRDPPDDL
jgi:hypothetical protein